MKDLPVSPRALRASAIDAVIVEFGARRVAIAALAALFRRRPRPVPLGLSDHLRRDVGMEPMRPPPSHWEHLR